MTGRPPVPTSHLRAALSAAAIASIALALGLLYCKDLERRYVHVIAPEFTDEKLQGVVLQKEAFKQPDLLVLYGSSELVKPIPNNANEFFQEYPTGFRVFPVGKPGTTALAILQKVAAVGNGMRGQKVAYSISPGNYFYEEFDPVTDKPLVIKKYYKGNFSELQARELAFSTRLSEGLKREVARRMLDFPETLDSWLLEVALQRLASDRLLDRCAYWALWPLGLLSNAVGRAQDHAEAGLHILDEEEEFNPSPKRGLQKLNWKSLAKISARLVQANVQAKTKQAAALKPRVPRDTTFLQNVARATEWTDAELLMRTFKELGAQPLLLCMPIEDIRLEAGGWSPAAREVFVKRFENLARRYGYQMVNFRDHERDSGFMVDFFDHLSAEGWVYYNQALDDFYHDRPLTPAAVATSENPPSHD